MALNLPDSKNGKSVPWYIVGSLIAGLLSGLGGTYAYQRVVPPRPDPFTSQDAAKLEEHLESQIADVLADHRRELLDYRTTQADLISEIRTKDIRLMGGIERLANEIRAIENRFSELPPPKFEARVLRLEELMRDLERWIWRHDHPADQTEGRGPKGQKPHT